jgi:carbon monoxide dehydrogenase subunit G
MLQTSEGIEAMDMTGEYLIAAPREAVWKALNDPEVLKQCIAGCDEMEKTSDTEFTAKVTAKVGPVRAKFGGAVTLSDIDPPNGYTISGEGTGGAAGFAKGGAKVELIADGDGTLLKYTVDATVGGKLAQIGSRLIDSTAKKYAKDFFSCFAEKVVASLGDEGEAPAEAAPAEPAAAAPRKKGLHPAVWVVGVIVVVLALALLIGS